MRRVQLAIERVAPRRVPVLLCGPSGSGKEVAASLIHASSTRAKRPFVKINCSALPRELVCSELYGSTKGAFTGALDSRPGLIRQAHPGGTVFLDELTELPLESQASLLRFLQEGEVRSVGAATTTRVDVRVVCASNRNIPRAIAEGQFREDLYYRVNTFQITLPALKDRPEEIIPLARAFLSEFSEKEEGLDDISFSEAAEAKLLAYNYPGNIRELKSLVQRAAIMTASPEILPEDIEIPASASNELENIYAPRCVCAQAV